MPPVSDLLLIALYAGAGAAAVGAAGALALRALRRRSVAVSLAVLTAVTVGAMLAGTLSVAWAMFLNRHDLTVVTVVCAVAAAASALTALLLGSRLIAGHRALERAARTLGREGGFIPPDSPAPAELASLARRLAEASASLADARERERALESSRRELVAWISHDLRSPLAGLRAMAEALEDGIAEDPDRYHRQIRSEVERLSAMVGDLFELSRIQAGSLALSPTRMSVYDLVSDAIAGAGPLAAERGVRLADDGVDTVPVEVDGREMTRVLANLLVNAIHRTPADGTVAVAARRAEGVGSAGGPGDAVVLSVTDGCGGIPAEDLPRVFDTGWRGSDARTPPAGAGLGLAIVRGIVEAHAGRASVRNVPGGCRFEVILPAAAPTPPPETGTGTGAGTGAGTGTAPVPAPAGAPSRSAPSPH
ncbi:two-component sensor histidine kinase [Streptomyces carminius]|uniref:histidine kinase n=1 Tax=Streptomyces carminius TaxID=2665496 RepID=A0A2M8M650_9ACTN|nr:HAMP domain-containing sensor histidine kinase [Streptomyces carminius]PJE99683.1 two-component sensor histidine kinase [Streptomyces carminius]